MAFKDDLANDVSKVLTATWDIRPGRVVPRTDSVKLTGGGVTLDAAVLYADLARSTTLAMQFDKKVAAKVAKCFMFACARIALHNNGNIRSYDGDRIMAVYLGDQKNTNAAKTALQINYAFRNIIKPKLHNQYPKLKNEFRLAHCTGVDSGKLLIVRGGVRDNNDLVWIGRAPNIAAKLSEFRNSPYHSYISARVYSKMLNSARYSNDGKMMWEKRMWNGGPISDMYRSNWAWIP